MLSGISVREYVTPKYFYAIMNKKITLYSSIVEYLSGFYRI